MRLVNGTLYQEGRIEICVNGVWGSICNNGWTSASAFIICKQLGFTDSGIQESHIIELIHVPTQIMYLP